MPFIIGLTGGIGSGKSTAARMLGDLGAGIIDTDAISHALTGPQGGAINALREAFGANCIRADGSLDRQRMREIAFANTPARKRLEGILHPMIRSEVEHQIARAVEPYLLLVVPLLLEGRGYLPIIRRVLVVDCDPGIQIARVMARSQLTREAVGAIMAAQVDRPTRLAAADDVLDNSGDEASLRAQVERLHGEYLRLAGTPKDC